MLKKTRTALVAIAAIGFAAPATASVPHSAADLLAQMSSSQNLADPYPSLSDKALKVAYHDMTHAQSVDAPNGIGAVKRGELRIDRRLNCFMAGTGDLICFSASLNEKAEPSQSATQDHQPVPILRQQ